MEQVNKKAIETQNLVKKFGDFTAVGGIDIEVKTGEIFGLLGPNGSGKTTTIRMMLGLLQPTEGWVRVLGIAVAENPEKLRPQIGYMAQRFSLYNDLTVMQNLNFYGKVYGLKNKELRERIGVAIEMAGLEGHEHKKTGELAGGWRQRLALGAAILHRPKIVFLDEPTAGVDPVSRREFWGLLYDLIQQGVTVFVTTHYMDEAEHCHRLAFIQSGEIIAYGSPEQIKEEMMHRQVLEITPDSTSKALQVLRDVQESGELNLEQVDMYGARLHVVVEDADQMIEPISKTLSEHNVQFASIEAIDPSLEDVFIASMK